MTPESALWVHSGFEWASLAVGAQIYFRSNRGEETRLTSAGFPLVVGCVLGAALGSKLAYLLYQPAAMHLYRLNLAAVYSGQSIVGGLLGGWLGVEGAKRLVGVRSSTGDAFVVPILVGLIIGRIGCFLAGQYDETSGLPTSLPWGYDYGDGIRRHPTQLFDMVFALAGLLVVPVLRPRLARYRGLLFKTLMAAYFLFRLGVDFLKPTPVHYLGAFSGIQVLALAGAVIFIVWAYQQTRSSP